MNPTRAELDGMMAVMEHAFDPMYGEAWNEQQLASAFLVPGTRFALIDVAGVIGPPSPSMPTAGFYLSRQIFDEEELMLLAVDPDLRRAGLATRLLEHMITNAVEHGTRKVFLEMREDNPAEYFYRRFGFKQIGERKDYYRGIDGTRRSAKTFATFVR